MNILVTGSNGQLGNEMRIAAKGNENRYLFTDVNQPAGVETLYLDITDLEAVRKMIADNKVDIIVNCAAYTNVDKAEEDELTADLINHKAVGYLAIAAKEAGATLIHISTDYVFNGESNVPYSEQDMTAPTGVYGKTKQAGENAVVSSGCNYIILRTAWLYSPWGKNFVKSMLQLTRDRDTISVIFDQIGTPTSAEDLADAIKWIIDRRMTGHKGIYHFSNEGVCSWYDFAVVIAKLGGNTCDVRPIHSDEYPSKVKRPHYSVLDKTKFRETFGYRIPYWMESLEKCINQLKNNESWNLKELSS